MEERGKTIAETQKALGVGRDTVYRLLKSGELKRAPSYNNKLKGRPITLVTASSIVNYLKDH